jgi:hypothetical protein
VAGAATTQETPMTSSARRLVAISSALLVLALPVVAWSQGKAPRASTSDTSDFKYGDSHFPIRYDPEWESSPPHVRQWFQNLKQPDNPRLSCCGEADSYEADLYEQDKDSYVAIITGQGPAVKKPYIPEGTRLKVPNHKIKWDEGNPTGHGIIFVGTNYTIFCYVPPTGI